VCVQKGLACCAPAAASRAACFHGDGTRSISDLLLWGCVGVAGSGAEAVAVATRAQKPDCARA
jgi:hypothetical protein